MSTSKLALTLCVLQGAATGFVLLPAAGPAASAGSTCEGTKYAGVLWGDLGVYRSRP